MTQEDAPKISDQIMGAFLIMFQTSTGKAGGVQEDALLAVSTLTEGNLEIGPRCEKTCLWGFRQNDTQNSLLSFRD